MAAVAWFTHYDVTSEDAAAMEDVRGRTLLPSRLKLPSGRTVTGDELRTWLNHQSPPAAADTQPS